MLCEKFVKKYRSHFYFVFRVFVGLLFMQHGAQKLFGMFNFQAAPLVSLFGLAGIIEFFGGLAIVLGFFTRLAATIAALEMVIAFFMGHVIPSGIWIPIINQGELALLFFASFLILIVHGAGKLSLERALLKKEVF